MSQGSFTSGTAAKLALTVDDGAGNLQVCSVTLTPTGSTTTLGAVLDAATSAATPSGCVTAVTPSSGTGTISSLNGDVGDVRVLVDVRLVAGGKRVTDRDVVPRVLTAAR